MILNSLFPAPAAIDIHQCSAHNLLKWEYKRGEKSSVLCPVGNLQAFIVQALGPLLIKVRACPLLGRTLRSERPESSTGGRVQHHGVIFLNLSQEIIMLIANREGHSLG